MPSEMQIRRFVRRSLYPLSWLWIILGLYGLLQIDADARPAWIIITAPLLILYLVLEITLPLDRRWSMSWRSLPVDVFYIALAGASIAVVTTLLAMISITLAGWSGGPARDWPLWVQVPVLFIGFEFMNYHIHRAMHEMRGSLGKLLWRVHAAHHLPEGLYLLMHAVSHPLNAIVIQGLAIILPIWVMGYTPEAVLIFLVVNGFHGIISHFNVDVAMGWANYVFVGPELHRYHHSADVDEAKNFGATLSIFDQLFGTFVYRPDRLPAALGVSPDAGMPSYRRVLSVLALPVRSQG